MSAFYRDTVGLTEIPSPRGGARWFKAAETIVMLELVSGAPAADAFASVRPGFHVVAFEIAKEARAALKQMFEERGVRIERESAYSLYIRDPEGNRLAFSHYPEALT